MSEAVRTDERVVAFISSTGYLRCPECAAPEQRTNPQYERNAAMRGERCDKCDKEVLPRREAGRPEAIESILEKPAGNVNAGELARLFEHLDGAPDDAAVEAKVADVREAAGMNADMMERLAVRLRRMRAGS